MGYKLLMWIKENNCEVHEAQVREKFWNVDILLYGHQIKRFCDIVGSSYFEDGEVEVILMNGYIGLNLYDVLGYLGMEHDEIIKECDKIKW